MDWATSPNPLLRKEGASYGERGEQNEPDIHPQHPPSQGGALYAWRERIGLDARLVAQWGAVGLNPSAGEPAAVCPPAWALCVQEANRT